eukprot:6527905-Prymnesium_polylepis.1
MSFERMIVFARSSVRFDVLEEDAVVNFIHLYSSSTCTPGACSISKPKPPRPRGRWRAQRRARRGSCGVRIVVYGLAAPGGAECSAVGAGGGERERENQPARREAAVDCST